MRTLTRVVSILFLLQALLGQSLSKDKPDVYSRVRIFARTSGDIQTLQQRGIDIEHYQGKVGEYIEVEINRYELDQVRASGIPYAVTVANMDDYYARRPAATSAELEVSSAILRQNGITSFTYGSMGGFHTYAQVVQKLDSMKMQYPNLITAKESIGVSWEGRTLWAVEISDNPGVAEPGEAVVYFDGLHHAREPEGMECLMYYMSWLLDNYGADPEATYLVNNRRIVFVPITNPDGYVYNQSTNPGGGGSWRKNRRNNGGSYGVDLNRNYGYQWGYDNSGSSPTASSDTYRGPSAFSEPETRAVRDFASSLHPTIGFSMHSYEGRYLNPWGYTDTPAGYEYYAEFASDFSRQNGYLYGTVMQMLAYTSNGTTRDYFHHDLNCLMWTPEVGGSGFWPAQSEIIPVAQENLLGLKYLSWVAGAFADYQSFHLVGSQNALPGGTLQFAVTVRNKGLTLNANSVSVSVQALYANVTPVVTSASCGSITPRQTASTDAAPFVYMIGSEASFLDEVKFVATVTQEGVVTSVDTFSIFLGNQQVLFSDDAESGRNNWTRGGSGGQWDTTFVMAHAGTHSFADSRYGNVTNSSTYTFTTTNYISLAGTANPRLEFSARWALLSGSSYYVRIQVSTNGTSWTNLSGRYTTTVSSAPGYTGMKGTWVLESINLNSYVGSQIKLRFSLKTGSGDQGDGFYFDDFRILDYTDVPLPIQMASFTASVVRNNDVEVAWKTVSETNNYGFEVYRKRNENGEWTKLGFIEGHGTTLAAQSYTYADKSVGFGKYYYQIKQIDLDGKSETFPEMEVTVGVAPEKLTLAQNYPNPFNPSTVIEFVVPKSGFATMKVYNVLGQEVATLFEGNADEGKIYTARFNASNLPSGVYFYTLRTAGKVETKRMLLLK
jgi:carboxypeptidase T